VGQCPRSLGLTATFSLQRPCTDSHILDTTQIWRRYCQSRIVPLTNDMIYLIVNRPLRT
jgi:hypothetical protein